MRVCVHVQWNRKKYILVYTPKYCTCTDTMVQKLNILLYICTCAGAGTMVNKYNDLMYKYMHRYDGTAHAIL